VRFAADEKERLQLWKCRKQAFGAIGRLSPSYCTQDGVVPRTRLPEILRRIRAIGEKYDLKIVNVFHAGDGNLHPILLFDERHPEEVKRVLAASGEILDACLACGGSVTGEHGIGLEKISFMNRMFTEDDLDVMARLRDALNPSGLLSPGKLLPTAGACGMEQVHPGRRAPL
jgi:glycolate oxidase